MEWEKKDKIKRSILAKGYFDGGLKMIDVDTYIKSIHLKWIQKIFKTKEANCTIIPKFYFNKIGSDLILFKRNLNKSLIDKNTTVLSGLN